MPFPSARLALLALILIVSPLAATASDGPASIRIPADADILITDGRGVIVGVGQAYGGTTFRLALVEGFSGSAMLMFVLDDGSFQEIPVVIGEGGVSIDGHRLGDLVAGTFAHVAIEREASGSRPSGEASRRGDAADEAPVGEAPVDVPPGATPPAVSTPGVSTPGVNAPGGARTPPAGAGRPDDEAAREPPSTEPPPGEAPTGPPSADEAPVDVPSPDVPSADEGPSETPDDAPVRGRP